MIVHGGQIAVKTADSGPPARLRCLLEPLKYSLFKRIRSRRVSASMLRARHEPDFRDLRIDFRELHRLRGTGFVICQSMNEQDRNMGVGDRDVRPGVGKVHSIAQGSV